LALGILLILISSSRLFFSGTQSSQGIKLGTLVSTLSVVKTKNATALDWRDASIGNDLTENQLIYTDAEARASVAFSEGGNLDIGESSLVRLRSNHGEKGMDVAKGFITARLGETPLKVRLNGEDYLLSGKGTDVQINLQDEKGEIGVVSGELRVEGNGLAETISPDLALEVDGEKVEKKKIAFKALSPMGILYVSEPRTSVSFEWNPAHGAQIVIGKNPSLKGAQGLTKNSGDSLELTPGRYFYRIENEEGTSLVQSFRLIQEVAPVLVRPLQGEQVLLEKNSDQGISLQWKDKERLTYDLEWDDGLLHTEVITGGSTVVYPKENSFFRWRLKIRDEKRPLAQWSSWQAPVLRHVSVPKVPSNLFPHDVEFQLYQKGGEEIDFSWASESPVVLEIRDPKGKVIEKKRADAGLKMFLTEAGSYTWRAKAVGEFLKESEWSEWKTFTLEDLSADGNQKSYRVQLKKPDQAVTFSWEGQDGEVGVFELAKDSSFKDIIRRQNVSGSSIQLSVKHVGTYYWRSRRFLPNGSVDVSEAKRVIIEPVPAPGKPEKLPDLELPLEAPKSSYFIKKIFDLLLPSAYAEEVSGMIRVELPIKEEAKKYVLRIYADPELQTLLLEEELLGKTFVWRGAREGTFYWQYALVDFWDRRSPFSDASQLTIRGKAHSPPVKVKLLTPIRAQEVDPNEIEFRWSHAEANSLYEFEASKDREFRKIVIEEKLKTPFLKLNWQEGTGLHYWRIKSLNSKHEEVVSNTGRFTVLPPLEQKLFITPASWEKSWRSRGALAWSPSKDSYTFKDGETGKIDGVALMGVTLWGTKFTENYAVSAELLRQSGEVFEGESYLFQRLLGDLVKTWSLTSNHRLGIGLALGHSSGQAYLVKDNEVKAESVSGLSYGLVMRDFWSFGPKWELQSKLSYLAGEIQQIDLSVDFLRHQKSFFWLGGLGLVMRDYEQSSGSQSSFKLSLGIGKEF
jgi:hypothetical protein